MSTDRHLTRARSAASAYRQRGNLSDSERLLLANLEATLALVKGIEELSSQIADNSDVLDDIGREVRNSALDILSSMPSQ